jgi:transcriptional regulator with PAS, ATPase and Fis domain
VTGPPVAGAVAGLTLGLLLAGLAYVLARGRSRATAELRAAEAEAVQADLRAARNTLADQQTYLTEVMDTIDVAVTTCDTSATMIHRNRAAKELTAGTSAARNLAGVARALRVTDPAGQPVPNDQLPMSRALAGSPRRQRHQVHRTRPARVPGHHRPRRPRRMDPR